MLEDLSHNDSLIWKIILTSRQLAHTNGSDVSGKGKDIYQICRAEFE